MTETEKTRHSEIGKKLEALKMYRGRVADCDNVLRWMDEQKQASPPVPEIKCQAEFKRPDNRPQRQHYYEQIVLPPNVFLVLLLLTKEHWASMIPPLEAWLDERNIEHTESAKAD